MYIDNLVLTATTSSAKRKTCASRRSPADVDDCDNDDDAEWRKYLKLDDDDAAAARRASAPIRHRHVTADVVATGNGDELSRDSRGGSSSGSLRTAETEQRNGGRSAWLVCVLIIPPLLAICRPSGCTVVASVTALR